MSTEKTRAPSLARSAASGRPTTSDLGVVKGCTTHRCDIPIDDGNSAAIGTVAVREERVVHADAFEGFHDAERRTGQDGLDGSWRWHVTFGRCGCVSERGRGGEEGVGLEIADAV